MSKLHTPAAGILVVAAGTIWAGSMHGCYGMALLFAAVGYVSACLGSIPWLRRGGSMRVVMRRAIPGGAMGSASVLCAGGGGASWWMVLVPAVLVGAVAWAITPAEDTPASHPTA